MSYRDTLIGSARTHLNNYEAHSQALTWFNSVVHYEYVNYGFRLDYSLSESDPWCAIFVSWCAAQAGILNIINPYECGTTEMKAIYDNTGRGKDASYSPTYGDTVFLNSSGGSGINHVGFVISSESDGLKILDGNTSTSPTGVNEHTVSYSLIRGYGVNIVNFNYYRGYLDVATDTIISGWAWNGFNDDVVGVHIYIIKNGQPLAVIPLLANQYRADLVGAGIGNGFHAYSYNPHIAASYGPGIYKIKVYMITNSINPEVTNSGKTIYVSVVNKIITDYLEIVSEETKNRTFIEDKIRPVY